MGGAGVKASFVRCEDPDNEKPPVRSPGVVRRLHEAETVIARESTMRVKGMLRRAAEGTSPIIQNGVAIQLPAPRPKWGRNSATVWSRETLWREKTRAEEETPAVLKEAAENTYRLLRICDELQGEEAKFRETQPEHVRRVQETKMHVSILNAIKLSKDEEANCSYKNSIERNFREGIPVFGSVQECGKYAKETKKERTDRIPLVIDPKNPAKSGKKYKIPKKPCAFMPEANLVRLWKEFKDDMKLNEALLDGKGRYPGEIGVEDLISDPIQAFGVEQGERDEYGIYKKLRRILNWREANLQSPMPERLRLTAAAALFEMLQICLNGAEEQEEFLPILQMTKDVLNDMGLLDPTGTPPDMQEWLSAEIKELKIVAGKMKEEDTSFLPAIGKKDFRKYYFQWAVDCPKANSVVIWDTEAKVMRIFTAEVSQFGNIHSIFAACRVSETLARSLNVLLKIPAMIYIDDTIIISRQSRLETCMACTQLTCVKWGLWMSSEKDESHLTQECLTVLGLAYRRIKAVEAAGGVAPETRAKMRILATERQKEAALEMLAETKRDFALAKANTKQIERLIGKTLYVVYTASNRGGMAVLRELNKWTKNPVFENRKKRTPERVRFIAHCTQLEEIASSNPKLDIQSVPAAAAATDASLENNRAVMGGITDAGKAYTVEATKEWLKETLEKAGWPSEKSRGAEHIQVFELLAVLLLLPKETKDANNWIGKRILLFVDNVAAAHALVKKSIRSPPAQIITEIIGDLLGEKRMISYTAHVKSKLNIADAFTRSDKFKELRSMINFDMQGSEDMQWAMDEIQKRIQQKVVQRARLEKDAEEFLESHRAEKDELKRQKKAATTEKREEVAKKRAAEPKESKNKRRKRERYGK